MAFRLVIFVPVTKVNPCFEGLQVQASGFAENLQPPASWRIVFSAKNLHTQTLPFCATKTTTTDPMERRITLNDKTMKKKNGNSNFENVSNEKQNSLASGIRIGLNGNFPVVKQKFVKIKEVEYSTNFDFFVQNQVHVIMSTNKICSICSSLENRVFWQGPRLDEDAIYSMIEAIHKDIISFRYGGELIY